MYSDLKNRVNVEAILQTALSEIFCINKAEVEVSDFDGEIRISIENTNVPTTDIANVAVAALHTTLKKKGFDYQISSDSSKNPITIAYLDNEPISKFKCRNNN